MAVVYPEYPEPTAHGEYVVRGWAGRALANLGLRAAAAGGPLIRRGSSDRLGHRAHLVARGTTPYVAKRSVLPADREDLWMEARMLPALRRFRAPHVTVPRLLHVAETTADLEIDLEWLAGYHSRVSLAGCIDGLDWLARLPQGAFADLPLLDTAALLAQTESDLVELMEYPGWERLVPEPEALLERLRRHAFALAAFPTVVAHNDYRPGNVLVRGQTIALIDWAQAARGTLLLDWTHLGVTRAEWLPALWRELRLRVADHPQQAAALPHAAWFCAIVAACHIAAHDAQQARGPLWYSRSVLRALLALEPASAQTSRTASFQR